MHPSLLGFLLPFLPQDCASIPAQDAGVVAAPAPRPSDWLERHDLRFGLYASFLARKDDHGIEGDPAPDDGDVTDIARLRQVDLSLSATLVEGVDAVMTASVQSNRINTEYRVDVEEAYLSVRNAPLWGELPAGLAFQLGQFRTHFGFLNGERVFDLPQLRRPRALTQFFGIDGYSQLGGSASYARDLPGGAGELRATWDLLDSGNPPLTIDDGGATGAQAARVAWSRGAGEAHEVRAGCSWYHGRQADLDERRTDLLGADALYTWRAPRAEGLNAWRVGGEWLAAEIEREAGPADEPEAWYAWTQLQLGERWLVGAHYDVSEELDAPERSTRTVGATLTYLESADLRYSLGVETTESDLDSLDGATRAFAAITFALGPAPRRPFWVR
ncbi:MAG: hypothetical protein QGI46_13115 [Planctomycetota bacterium]|nr:hypothetical protein [Planctomycetota bacterium]